MIPNLTERLSWAFLFMKLPAHIHGRNKIRDAQILMAWGQDHKDTETIAHEFGLAERRILQILRANHKALPIDKDWEKQKRIQRLQRWLIKKPETNRDALEVQEQLRKEIEGDKPEIDNSKHLHQTYVWINQSPTNSIPTPRLSAADTLPPSEIQGS